MVSSDKIASVIRQAFFVDVKRFLSIRLKSSNVFRNRFVHVAKRFGLLKREVDYRGFSIKRLVEVLKDSIISQEAFDELCYDRLDIANCQSVLDDLSRGKKFFETSKDGFSPLAKNALSLGGFGELVSVAEPGEKVLDAFSKELGEKKAEFYCLYCKSAFSRLVKEVSSFLCPFCSSTELTLEKYVGEKGEHRVSAILSSYHVRGLKAMMTYGVGPETASRILSRLHSDEEQFLTDLLEAQKDFIRTRKYWRV